jgi:outer membrane protein assembly factor BamE (lipoprotein component of BamABCDE complex)
MLDVPVLRHSRRIAAAGCLALALAGCSPVINVRGYVPDEDRLATITPKQTKRAEVERALGSPSTVSPFNDKVWYYMTETTEQVAFFDPDVLERKVIAIVFDEGDIVEDVVTYTEADGQKVKIVSRTTPTAGNEVTILQQLFGNIGRFTDKDNQ